ncbi:MAG: hypothetical protein AAFY72_05205 [Cyanobacteria bacterium J06649_4]
MPASAQPFTTLDDVSAFMYNPNAPDLCNEEGLGYNSQNNNGYSHHSTSTTRAGGGKIGFKGFSIGGGGSNSESETNNNGWNYDSRRLVTGQDCSDLVNGLSNIAITQINNETTRYGIDSQERMNQVNNDTQRYMFDGSMRQDFLNNGMFR